MPPRRKGLRRYSHSRSQEFRHFNVDSSKADVFKRCDSAPEETARGRSGGRYRRKAGDSAAGVAHMKITCLGGGPGGLYFAILAKKANPSWDFTVIERNSSDSTFGWGVVFS